MAVAVAAAVVIAVASVATEAAVAAVVALAVETVAAAEEGSAAETVGVDAETLAAVAVCPCVGARLAEVVAVEAVRRHRRRFISMFLPCHDHSRVFSRRGRLVLL